MVGKNWWKNLNLELDQQLEKLLEEHPRQKELLQKEELPSGKESPQQLINKIESEASGLRQDLMRISKEISEWILRVKKAQDASETQLATQAINHVENLKRTGQLKWNRLVELGNMINELKHD